MPLVTCAVTGETHEAKSRNNGSPAVPKGWHLLDGQWYSPKGWKTRFVLRTQTIAIASVVEGYDPKKWSQQACAAGRDAFKKAFRESSRACRHLTNWLLSKLASLDCKPPVWHEAEGDKAGYWKLADFKLDKPEQLTLQREASRTFAHVLDSQSIYSLFGKVQSKYIRHRFAIRALHSESLPLGRFKLPIPIPATAIARPITMNRVGLAFIGIRLAGGQRFTLRLAGGKEWQRQLCALRGVAAGELLQGELLLREKVIMSNQRGNGSFASPPRSQGDSGPRKSNSASRHQTGGRGRPTRIMCSIPVYLPRQERTSERAMLIRTDPEAFLVCEVDSRAGAFILNYDQLKQAERQMRRAGDLRHWIDCHEVYLQRISEDTKYEKRWPRSVKLNINESRDRRCRKHAHWIKDQIAQAVASVCKFAERQDVGLIRFDDSIRTFVSSFPWRMMAEMFANKFDELGFEHNIDLRTRREKAEEESRIEACSIGESD
jgi:hypothetical protein